MGKISDLDGVIGNFFTDGEELTPGQALARINKSTDANDFVIVPLDGAGSPTTADVAISYSLQDCSNAAAIDADAVNLEKLTAVPSTNAWTWSNDLGGGGAADLANPNEAMKAATVIDMLLEVKTRIAGFNSSATSFTKAILWSQSESALYVIDSGVQPVGVEFAKMTASAVGKDFGE